MNRDSGLHAPRNGLAIIARILAGARRHLEPRGILVVEAGDTEHAVRRRWPSLPFTWLEFEHGGGGVFLLNASPALGTGMSGNTIGKLFAVTTFGESHGPALGAIVDGCPPGLALSEEDLQADLELRRTGTSKHTSQRKEPDRVRILSGVFEGRTTGTAIGLIIDNVDQRSRDYEKIKDRFRPGHADYAYQQKYGFRDYRGGGRSSARITVATVAAGAIARKYLREKLGLEVAGYLSQAGPHRLECVDLASGARQSVLLRGSGRRSRCSRNTSGSCARTATRSAPRSRCWRAGCRRASASRCSTGWMPTSPSQ